MFLPLSLFPHPLGSDSHLNHTFPGHVQHAATPPNVDTNNTGSGSGHPVEPVSMHRDNIARPTSSRRPARRPVARTSTNRNSSVSQRPVIVIGSDSSDED